MLGMLLWCLILQAAAAPPPDVVRIGVLANNGRGMALKAWRPHAEYLEKSIPGRHFKVVPLEFAALYPAVRNRQVDFVVVNTGQYVELEAEAGITRIATLKTKGPGGTYTVFGGVLLTRSDRKDINELGDLRGKRVWVPDSTSFGGWLMQLREIKAAGITPGQFAELKSTDCHEEVVRAVLAGHADVGAVRTGTLEAMAQAGLVDLRRIKVINARQADGFPFLLSTRLYPEWSFSRLRHTDDQLAQQVAVALLNMPQRHPAAEAAGIGGWTIAADYTAAHDLYRELKLGPYREQGRYNFRDVLKRYWPLALLSGAVMLLLVMAVLFVVRVNRRLGATLSELEQQRQTTQWALDNLSEQTAQLEQTNEELVTINDQMTAANFERELLMDALKRNEEQLRLLLDSTAEAIYGTDLQGVCTFCNTACLKLLGYDRPEDLIGKNMHLLIHYRRKDGNVYPEHDCRIFQALQQGEGIHVEDEVFWRKDGQPVPVEYWSYPQTRNGEIVGTVATFLDISDRLKSQEKLLMLSRAVENSPAVVVITDREGRIEYVNSKFIERTGYSIEEAVGENPRILNAGVQTKEFYKELWDTIIAGHEWRGEFCNRKKNGDVHWEFASISPIRDEQGRIAHFVAVKEDITERRRIAEELQRAKEEAEAGNRSKSEFLANMSHEIRTPLNAIIGFNELTLETELSGQQREYLNRVGFAATSLLRIINDILDFSKIEAGKLEFETVPFSPCEVAQNTVNLFQQQALSKGLPLTLHCADNMPAQIFGDPVRLGQVLVNLMGNAVKFTEQGAVSLHLAPLEFSEQRVVLEFAVHDTGIGLTRDTLDQLFQPFTQADGSITRKFGGTGLGLSISKRIVELMGGHIWAQSELGRGSTFAFSVPFELVLSDSYSGQLAEVLGRSASRQTSVLAAAVESNGVAAELSGARILLVEDNEMNRALAIELLQRRGAQLDIATNGCEAVTKVMYGSTRYDLVLMDLQMPGMDGYEATRRIREDSRFTGLPIIAMTAHALLEERERCVALGMNGHISKPLNAVEMVRVLQQYLPRQAVAVDSSTAQPIDDSELPNIPGLAMHEALERIDYDLPLYTWLLHSFVDKHEAAADDIRRACEQGDRELARRRVHTVRGLAGSIGATELFKRAEGLELAMLSGEGRERYSECLLQFEQTLQAQIAQIRAGLEITAAGMVEIEATEVDLERVRQVLGRLCGHLREHDGYAVRYLQENRSELTVLPSYTVDMLQTSLAHYDYDAALVQLQQIAKQLGMVVDDCCAAGME